MKRFLAASLGLLLAGASLAQSPYPAFRGMVIARPGGGAAGQAQAGSSDQPLPPPARPRGEELKLVNAESYSEIGSQIRAEGSVIISFRGYDMRADEIVGDKSTEVFLLKGAARVVGEGNEITGREIEVDFRRNVFRYLSALARLSPSTVGGGVQTDMFVGGSVGIGTSKEIRSQAGSLTTCELEGPHFELKSRSTVIVPGRYAKLNSVTLEILGQRVFWLPMLIVPLQRNPDRYLPEFGQSPDEGYYLKAKFGTPLRRDDYLEHRVDLMQKKGVGLGTDWVYDRGPALTGRASAYVLRGPQPSSQLSLDHRMRLGGGDLTASAQYQQTNFLLAPQNTFLTTRAQYVFPLLGGQTRLGYNRSSNQSPFFSSINQGWSFGDQRKIGRFLSTSLDLNFNSSESRSQGGFGQKNEMLDVRFGSQLELPAFSADLKYNRVVPVEGQVFASGADQTPAITLATTTRRLLGQKKGRLFPLNMEVSGAEMYEAGRDDPLKRLSLRADSRSTWNTGPFQLDYGGRFVQGMYSDNTAQYILNYDARASLKFAGQGTFNLNYRNLRAFGFTPLSIDRTGRSDSFDADLSWRPIRSLQLSGSTGYDVLQSSRGFVPWQFISLRGEWTPSKSARVRASSAYDTFSTVWSSFNIDADFMVQGARFIVGARYDGRRKQLAGASIIAGNLRWGRIKGSVLADYNGYTKQVEALQYQLIYDMHCTEAVIEVVDNRIGFRSGRQIGFYIRLKAFPSFSGFGIGRRGQAVGTGGSFGTGF